MKKNQLTHLRWLILSLLLATGVGSAWGQTTDTYTFTSKAWAANPANWTSGKDGNQMTSIANLISNIPAYSSLNNRS